MLQINIIPADELLKYKIPKKLFNNDSNVSYLFAENKTIINNDCELSTEMYYRNFKNIGYRFPDSYKSRLFDIIMSIAFQQKDSQVTLNILMRIFSCIYVEHQNVYIFDRHNVSFDKNIKLTKIERSILIYAGIIKKINNEVNIMQYANSNSNISYILESSDKYTYSKSIGRISLKNKNADNLINMYNANIHIYEIPINDHANFIINHINGIYTRRIAKILNDIEETKMNELIRIKEKEKGIKDLENFKIFLLLYCDIGEADIKVILNNIAGYTSCEKICYATNSFLNSHIPVRFVKNISDALSGVPNKYGQCPLCFIYNSGGPSCTKHIIYKDAKSNNKCAVCMQNNVNIMVKCNHEFCKSCIDKWLENNSTCPLCRDSLK